MRVLLARLARAAAFAALYGVLVTFLFYALIQQARAEAQRLPETALRGARWETLPKPEEFGWLVGAILLAGLALPVLGSRWAWPTRAVRGVLVAGALALPAYHLGVAVTGEGGWMALFVGGPAFVAALLTPLPRVADDAREDEELRPAVA